MRRELATWADLIVTMTAEQAEEVAEMAPEAEAKTFTLKELVPLLEDPSPPPTAERDEILRRIGEAHRIRTQRGVAGTAHLTDVDVADPLGLSDVVYRAVANEVEGLIDRLVTGLVGRRDATLATDA